MYVCMSVCAFTNSSETNKRIFSKITQMIDNISGVARKNFGHLMPKFKVTRGQKVNKDYKQHLSTFAYLSELGRVNFLSAVPLNCNFLRFCYKVTNICRTERYNLPLERSWNSRCNEYNQWSVFRLFCQIKRLKQNLGENLRPVIFLTSGHFKMRAFSDKRQKIQQLK